MKKLLIILSALLIIAIVLPNYIIEAKTDKYVFDQIDEIPKNKVGLVLGTSKWSRGGGVNLFFKYRIDATLELYNHGKIDFILVSGDNSLMEYNEPMFFKKELVKRGIPEEKIFLDYAGFRTLDSVIRASKIFGQISYTVISQEFHNRRAIFIGSLNDINVIGFNAKDVSNRYGFKVYLREYLARTKVFVDELFNIQPKFLGPKIEIK